MAHDIVSRDIGKESKGYKDNLSFTQMLMVTSLFNLGDTIHRFAHDVFFSKKNVHFIHRDHSQMMFLITSGEAGSGEVLLLPFCSS